MMRLRSGVQQLFTQPLLDDSALGKRTLRAKPLLDALWGANAGGANNGTGSEIRLGILSATPVLTNSSKALNISGAASSIFDGTLDGFVILAVNKNSRHVTAAISCVV
jgi:hypothetical protein